MTIYIANLTAVINSKDLKELFGPYGEVTSAKIINDQTTGKSRGFGFVEMPDDAAAKKAIAELNAANYDGQNIAVSEARPRAPRNNDNNYSNSGFNQRSGGNFNSGKKRW